MMIRWITWIEEHIDGFFKLNAFIWLISIAITVTGSYFMISGWMMHSTATWSSAQLWAMWWPVITASFTGLLFSVLFFTRLYIAFPVVFFYLAPFLPATLYGIKDLLKNGFLYPASDLSNLFDLLVFILTVIGTILCARKVYFWFDKK